MKLRVLAASFDYRPGLGGVATCGYELSRAMNRIPGVELKFMAPHMEGAEEFDRKEDFETKRIKLPSETYFAVLPFAAHLTKEMLKWKPDVVFHYLWLPSGLSSLLISSAFPNTPYFVVAHGVEVIESDRTFKKKLRKGLSRIKSSVFQHAKMNYAVSHFTGNLLNTLCGVPKDRIHIITNGVDPARFEPGPKPKHLLDKYGIHGRRIFLTVTRLIDYKGVDRAIAALRFVVNKHPDVVYVVCGAGPDRERQEAIARHYRVSEHVIFTGPIQDSELNDYYNLSDCFVLLSREDWVTPNFEGFGVVLLEAAACRKPSIGGRSGGIPDAVLDGRTGWVIDPWDDQEIAGAMLEVLEHPEEKERRGNAAYERALGSMTWRHVAENICQEVNRLVRD